MLRIGPHQQPSSPPHRDTLDQSGCSHGPDSPHTTLMAQVPRLLRDWDANSAVAPPACLGLEAGVVGWPGMRTIRGGASVVPCCTPGCGARRSGPMTRTITRSSGVSWWRWVHMLTLDTSFLTTVRRISESPFTAGFCARADLPLWCVRLTRSSAPASGIRPSLKIRT